MLVQGGHHSPQSRFAVIRPEPWEWPQALFYPIHFTLDRPFEGEVQCIEVIQAFGLSGMNGDTWMRILCSARMDATSLSRYTLSSSHLFITPFTPLVIIDHCPRVVAHGAHLPQRWTGWE